MTKFINALLMLSIIATTASPSYAGGKRERNGKEEALNPTRLLPVNEGYNDLHEAAAQGNLPEIARLLADGSFDAPGPYDITALHVAARFGQVEAMRMLIQDGRFDAVTAVPQSQRYYLGFPRRGWTALHEAAQYGQLAAMRLLLDHGGFNASDDASDTALDVAMSFGQAAVMRHLIEDGRFNRDDMLHRAAGCGWV